MPVPIAVADAQYRFNWSQWPVPEMPEVHTEPWEGVPGCFWREDITQRPVDHERTRALIDFDVPIKTGGAGAAPWQGTSYGMPFQLIDAKASTTGVEDASQPAPWELYFNSWTDWGLRRRPVMVNVPLPAIVRREGDPGAPNNSDLHWYGYDPNGQVLWEAITLRTLGDRWLAGYMGGGPGVGRWDCRKPWNAPGQPVGVVAGGTPQFPMICRWDEIRRGRIGHAIFGVLPNYAPAKTGPARGTDGSLVGHPVRAGERLRLRRSVVERFSPGTTQRIVAQALYEYGWVQLDKNAATGTPAKIGQGGFPTTQDRRWHTGDDLHGPLGDMRLKLTDFEVLTQ